MSFFFHFSYPPWRFLIEMRIFLYAVQYSKYLITKGPNRLGNEQSSITRHTDCEGVRVSDLRTPKLHRTGHVIWLCHLNEPMMLVSRYSFTELDRLKAHVLLTNGAVLLRAIYVLTPDWWNLCSVAHLIRFFSLRHFTSSICNHPFSTSCLFRSSPPWTPFRMGSPKSQGRRPARDGRGYAAGRVHILPWNIRAKRFQNRPPNIYQGIPQFMWV